MNELLKRAIDIHSNMLDLSQADFQTWKQKVKVGCHACGHWWTVTPNNLISRKSGCPKCSYAKRVTKPHSGEHWRNVRRTTVEFVGDAIAKHGDKYDYSRASYETQNVRVELGCRRCGLWFKQTPVQHLHGNEGRGSGCPRCARDVVTSSRIENEWLDKLEIPLARRQDWVSLDGRSIRVDALWQEIAYEFLGKFWHGDPRRYDHAKLNVLVGKTFGELYGETVERIEKLRLLFDVKYVWEVDYRKGLMFSDAHPVP